MNRSLELSHEGQPTDRTYLTLFEIITEIGAHSVDEEKLLLFLVRTLMGHFGVLKVAVATTDDEGNLRFSLSEGIEVSGRLELPPEKYQKLLGLDSAEELRAEDSEVFDRLLKLGLVVYTSLTHTDSYGRVTLEGIVFVGPKLNRKPYAEEEKRFLFLAGRILAISLHNHRLFRKSITDELTRVFRREHLIAYLDKELRLSAGQETSILWVDVDNLKEINDTGGHIVGDEALVKVAAVLRSTVRPDDVVGRFGGDEFVVVLPLCRKDMAVLIAERMRSEIAKLRLSSGASVTVSVGVASAPEDGTDRSELLEKADQSLYLAKSVGKNRVSTVGPPEKFAERRLLEREYSHRLPEAIRSLKLTITADAVERVTELLFGSGVNRLELTVNGGVEEEICRVTFVHSLPQELTRELEDSLRTIPGVVEVALRPESESSIKVRGAGNGTKT